MHPVFLPRGHSATTVPVTFVNAATWRDLRARIKPLAQGGPSGGVNEGYRNRRGGMAAGKKDRMHRKVVLNGPC